MNLRGPGALCLGRLLITDDISLIVIGLLRWCISPCEDFGNLVNLYHFFKVDETSSSGSFFISNISYLCLPSLFLGKFSPETCQFHRSFPRAGVCFC